MNTTQRRQLERAGYVCLRDVWVDRHLAREVLEHADKVRPTVERIAAEPARPVGRPPKKGEVLKPGPLGGHAVDADHPVELGRG